MQKSKGGTILEIIGARNISDLHVPQNMDVVFETRPYLPIRWNEHKKKWMGHD